MQSPVPRSLTANEASAIAIAQENGGKLTRSPLGIWSGKPSEKNTPTVDALTVARLVKIGRMAYTARKESGARQATEASLVNQSNESAQP